MPAERLPMRKLHELLRLRLANGLTQRAIARSLGLSQGAVCDYLGRVRRAGLSWPAVSSLDDAELERLLFRLRRQSLPNSVRSRTGRWSIASPAAACDAGPSVGGVPGERARWLWLFWFCDLYKAWAGKLKPTMRQAHVAGERLFVDFAGKTVEVIDAVTGEVRAAHIFVAVLGASSFTYAEATWSETLPDWIGAHVRTFRYLGGAAQLTVSDNLKAGITRACFREPTVNRTYADLARHYGTAIVPARPYKPRDKAKVEVGVQVVERWILARLRHHRFFSLAALNDAIRTLLDDLNARSMRGLGTSRRALFEQLDRPALLPLPAVDYEYAEWKRCRVGLDYHVEIARHYYSVPYRLLRQEVEARITTATVEIFHRGKRVASHVRCHRPHRPSTIAEHMPSSHRRYRDWTHERICREAAGIGADAATLVDVILRSRPHPEQGFRSRIGILGLVKRFGGERVDAACARALAIGTRSWLGGGDLEEPQGAGR